MVWKAIIYFLLILASAIFLIYLCVNPVLDLLRRSGFVTTIVEMYTEFMTSMDLTKLFESISVFVDDVLDTLARNMHKIWWNFSGIALVIFFFNVLMGNLTIMPYCNSLNYYMGSMTKKGFYSSLFETFWKNLKVQLVYFVFSLPIKLLLVSFLILALKLFSYSWWVSIFAVFIIVIGIVLIEAFKYTLFGSWIPTMVILNYSVMKSFRIAIKSSFRNFGRNFGCAIGIVMVIMSVNVFFGLFTCLVGLIVTIPASFLLYSSFGMVSTYEAQGMRYYVDIYNVITPKKKERLDKLTDMKYII